MSNSLPLLVTIEHERIRAWAEHMGLRPALPYPENRPYPLFLTKAPFAPDMREVNWADFFAEFERANVAFVYRASNADVREDADYSFVNRTNVPELTSNQKTAVMEQVV